LRRLLSTFVKVPVGFIRTGRAWAAGSSGVLYCFHERRISMSVYLVKGKGWRYDFTLKGTRYTETWFKTKTKARKAEVERREKLKNPTTVAKTPIDMGFLELVNKRLDYVKEYDSDRHYTDSVYMAKRWTQRWGDLLCSEVTEEMVQRFVLERKSVSSETANKEIRYLKATFNFGRKKKWITVNPAEGVEFLPRTKKKKKRYVPPPEHIDKIIDLATPDTQDYLWAIRETLARVSEINRLGWDDVHFKEKAISLYTRKKKGGSLTENQVPLTKMLFEILSRRYEERDKTKPWVFWHRYWSKKENRFKEGPYQDRNKFMATLCKKAGVPYFRFHPLRHSGASVMDNEDVPIGSIQRILGHENRKTTEIYLHSLGNSEREAMSAFERASRKSHTKSHTTKKKEPNRVIRNSLTP
jgi:integrase